MFIIYFEIYSVDYFLLSSARLSHFSHTITSQNFQTETSRSENKLFKLLKAIKMHLTFISLQKSTKLMNQVPFNAIKYTIFTRFNDCRFDDAVDVNQNFFSIKKTQALESGSK